MSEMIEKIAQAISLWDGDDWNGVLGSRDCSRNRYRDMARAAIEAMREANDDICVAFYSEWRPSGMEEPREVWKAMIDAALNPSQT